MCDVSWAGVVLNVEDCGGAKVTCKGRGYLFDLERFDVGKWRREFFSGVRLSERVNEREGKYEDCDVCEAKTRGWVTVKRTTVDAAPESNER